MFSRVYLIILCLFMASCIDQGRVRTDSGTSTSGSATEVGETQWLEAAPEVELSHFIDPFDGSYTRKLSLPRNYDGQLYISGLNVGTLADKSLRVRFSFGREKEAVTLTATTGKGPGATENTVVDVLIVDLEGQEEGNDLFSVQLFYDLFDYNKYDFDYAPGSTFGVDVAQDNRDPGLYCRGLLLDDDPTFSGSGCNANDIDQACLYSYASIKDQGLKKDTFGTGSYFYSVPTKQHISSESATAYYLNSDANMTNRCLQEFSPDPSVVVDTGAILLYKYSDSLDFMSWLQIGAIGGQNYQYAGPYRIVNKSLWALPSASYSAVFGKYGVFRKSLRPVVAGISEQVDAGVVSNLFPRYTKSNLGINVDHLATSTAIDPGATKSVQALSASGDTNWMDGCNARVASWNPSTGEGIGSCNVTGKVEILYFDFQQNKNIKLLESKKLKLQLVRPSILDDDGNDVLANNFSACTESSECGGDSCCFNKRCWSKTIVSQCLEEEQNTGNRPSGSVCSSDLQCASLCCDQTFGVCNVHQNTGENPVRCNKAPGQACLAKDWCQRQTVPECYVVSTGPGATDCMYQCFNVERFGDCVDNTCRAPVPRQSDPWNPADPNRCQNARPASSVPLPF